MSDRIDEIRARWAKATPGPYRRLTWTFESMDQQTAEWSQALRNRPDGLTSHAVWVVDTDLFVASTGNGPTSEVNAEAIAAAPEDVAYLLAEVERLRARICPVCNGMRRVWVGEDPRPERCEACR